MGRYLPSARLVGRFSRVPGSFLPGPFSFFTKRSAEAAATPARAEHETKLAFAHVLRGIAALSVVISHCLVAFWVARNLSDTVNLPAVPTSVPDPLIVEIASVIPFPVWGAFGVALFFVISGFVIPFTLQRRSGCSFLVARFLRIWPTLAVCMFIAAAAIFWNSRLEGRPLPWTVADWFANISLAGDYLRAPRIDGVVWTLEIEIKFYIITALITGILRRGQLAQLLIVALAIASVAAAIELLIFAFASVVGPYLLFMQFARTDMHMISFMFIGIVFNFQYRQVIAVRTAGAAILGLTAVNVLLWLGTPYGGGWQSQLMFITCYVGAVAAFAACFVARRHFSMNGIWGFLGDISYPLYLGHATIGYTLLNHLVRAGVPPTLAIAITLAAIICLATCVHHLVEMPSSEYGRRLASRLDRWVASTDSQAFRRWLVPLRESVRGWR